jgi:cold shock CspA family protein
MNFSRYGAEIFRTRTNVALGLRRSSFSPESVFKLRANGTRLASAQAGRSSPMKIPVQVTFRNMSPSEPLEALVRERARQLEDFYAGMMACRVVVEIPHRHHQAGNRCHVRIDLTVPDDEIVVSREPSVHGSLKDLSSTETTKATDIASIHAHAEVAIREAFDAARRRLQDYARRQRGAVKAHEAPGHGEVVRIGPEEGWIRTSDGREVYFHERSVLDRRFNDLEEGSPVAFVEEKGEKGPQASTVRMLGKHHYV